MFVCVCGRDEGEGEMRESERKEQQKKRSGGAGEMAHPSQLIRQNLSVPNQRRSLDPQTVV